MINMQVDSVSLKHLTSAFDKLAVSFPNEVTKVIHREGIIIETNAKKNLMKELVNSPRKKNGRPYYAGFLSSSIHNVLYRNGVTVGTNLKYAPYVEFGTGDGVQVPTGWESFAMQFKGAGIRKVNNRARPYLVRAFIEETPKIEGKLVTLYRRLLK